MDISTLPENAQAELYDFFLFLKQRYSKHPEPTKQEQSRIERLRCLKVDNFISLSRDEIYDCSCND